MKTKKIIWLLVPTVAKNNGRNSLSWFLLGLIWTYIALALLSAAPYLKPGRSDILARFMWILTAVIAIAVIIILSSGKN
jgi:hypothetical protein